MVLPMPTGVNTVWGDRGGACICKLLSFSVSLPYPSVVWDQLAMESPPEST